MAEGNAAPICAVTDCGSPQASRGFCPRHYMRWKRHGDPEKVMLIHGDHERRFWTTVDKRPDGCWEWTGARYLSGYGRFTVSSRPVSAHRWAYQLLVGPVPDGLVLDHLCRNRLCVNPEHLEPVTNRENILRGEGEAALHARQTSCKRGHPLSGDNLYRGAKGDRRQCRECARQGQITRRARARRLQERNL